MHPPSTILYVVYRSPVNMLTISTPDPIAALASNLSSAICSGLLSFCAFLYDSMNCAVSISLTSMLLSTTA